MVGKTGFEPATSWSQTTRSAKLSHFPKLVSQERFERPTDALEGRCSIQLSYWDMNKLFSMLIHYTILFFNFQYLFLIFRKFSYYLYRFQHFLRHSYQKQIILSYLMYLYLLFFDSNFHIMTH